MEFEFLNEEAQKLWKKMSSDAPVGSKLHLELDLYKKLLNFFQVGDYYYFIFNLQNFEFDLLSPEIEQLLGYKPGEVSPASFMDFMHPDDRPWFLSFETRTGEFLARLPIDKLMKYKARYDFRFRKKNGEYIRVLHQVVIIQHDEKGGIFRSLGVHTDITDLKPEGRPVMSLIGLDGEPSYLNIDVENPFPQSREVLSRREKEVLKLLIEGKASKQISNELNISTRTVDTHRKNMLRKNELRSTAELVGKAIRHGWI